MIEKIKEKIKENKKDTSTFIEYIKSFCESEKANEFYKDDVDFKNLKKIYLNEKKEEDY